MVGGFAKGYQYDQLPYHMLNTDSIIVLRHGPQIKEGFPSQTPGDEGDRKRPLSPEGKDMLTALGYKLLGSKQYGRVDVKVSDFQRTTDSAQAFAEPVKFATTPFQYFESLGYSRPNFLDNLIKPKFGHDKPTADAYVAGMLEQHFFASKDNPATPTVSALMRGLAEALNNSLHQIAYNIHQNNVPSLDIIVTHGGGIVDLMPLLASGGWNSTNPNNYLTVDFEKGRTQVDPSTYPGSVATAEPAFVSFDYSKRFSQSVIVESMGRVQGYKISDIKRMRDDLKRASETHV